MNETAFRVWVVGLLLVAVIALFFFDHREQGPQEPPKLDVSEELELIDHAQEHIRDAIRDLEPDPEVERQK